MNIIIIVFLYEEYHRLNFILLKNKIAEDNFSLHCNIAVSYSATAYFYAN
jgi:hypothetical protein